eukprot:1679289-Rhodomonas_salina.1
MARAGEVILTDMRGGPPETCHPPRRLARLTRTHSFTHKTTYHTQSFIPNLARTRPASLRPHLHGVSARRGHLGFRRKEAARHRPGGGSATMPQEATNSMYTYLPAHGCHDTRAGPSETGPPRLADWQLTRNTKTQLRSRLHEQRPGLSTRKPAYQLTGSWLPTGRLRFSENQLTGDDGWQPKETTAVDDQPSVGCWDIAMYGNLLAVQSRPSGVEGGPWAGDVQTTHPSSVGMTSLLLGPIGDLEGAQTKITKNAIIKLDWAGLASVNGLCLGEASSTSKRWMADRGAV